MDFTLLGQDFSLPINETGTGEVIATGETFPVSGSFISTGIKQ